MHEKFINYFSKISPLSIEESEALITSMQTKVLKKGAYLSKEGQISANTSVKLSFIQSNLIDLG